MYRTDFGTLWEKARVGCLERTISKHVNYLGWNRSLSQVGCTRQVLGSGSLGRPRGMRLGGRWDGGSGWGTHVNPWLIHINIWQKPLQYCKVISLQLIKINGKKVKKLQAQSKIKNLIFQKRDGSSLLCLNSMKPHLSFECISTCNTLKKTGKRQFIENMKHGDWSWNVAFMWCFWNTVYILSKEKDLGESESNF